MSFWRIAWKNIRQRWLASSLTALSMALGVVAMVCVIVIYSVTVKQFNSNAQGYNLIVGGKGGKLQLVLTTAYNLGVPLYPVPYDYYHQFVNGQYSDMTAVAIPYCMGDSFDPDQNFDDPSGQRYRVVATTPDLFDKIQYGMADNGKPLEYTFSEGKNFRSDHAYQAVLGSVVAAKSGIEVGDKMNINCGISGNDTHNEQSFVVTGILDSTGTPNDHVAFVNIEGFYLLNGHALKPSNEVIRELVPGAAVASELGWEQGDRISIIRRLQGGLSEANEFSVVGIRQSKDSVIDSSIVTDVKTSPKETLSDSLAESKTSSERRVESGLKELKGTLAPDKLYDNAGNLIEPLPYDQREVTSILVLCTNDLFSGLLNTRINKDAGQALQAVAPAGIIDQLLHSIVDPIRTVLLVLTILIVVVAAISILVSIYNSMNERSQDIAIMRAVGASRASVMQIILTESVLLSLAGGIFGILLGHGMIALAAPYVEYQTGIRLAFWHFDPWELAVIPGLMAVAALAGLLPAITAYRTDVANSLR